MSVDTMGSNSLCTRFYIKMALDCKSAITMLISTLKLVQIQGFLHIWRGGEDPVCNNRVFTHIYMKMATVGINVPSVLINTLKLL